MEITTGISNEERAANKAMYVGKRLYSLFVEVANELASASKNGVLAGELGIFEKLDTAAYIAAAREIGQVPVWNAEKTPKGKSLSYPPGTTGVNS